MKQIGAKGEREEGREQEDDEKATRARIMRREVKGEKDEEAK